MDVTLVVKGDAVEVMSYSAKGDDCSPSMQSPEAEVGTVIEMVQIGDGDLARSYEVRFSRDGIGWKATRTQLLVAVRERSGAAINAPNSTPVRRSEDGQWIIDDIRANREMVLSTAAMLIAEQDPTRLENIAMALGPLALFKVGKLRRLAQTRRLANVGKLRLRVINRLSRGRYHVARPIDPGLVEQARQVRATQGLSPSDFNLNVATAKIEIGGEVRFIDHANSPGGLHSEQHLVSWLQKERAAGKEVRLHQLYSERHPCAACRGLLDTEFPAADVFWSVPQGRSSNKALQKAWNLLD